MLAMTMREWIPAFAGMEILMSVVHFFTNSMKGGQVRTSTKVECRRKPDPIKNGCDFDPNRPVDTVHLLHMLRKVYITA